MTTPPAPGPLPAGVLKLSKRVLSLYFRVGCDKQFLLYLYGDAEREQYGMPPRQGGRAGLGLVGRHGYEHQAAKVRELQTAFGAASVVVGPIVNTLGQTAPISLFPVLPTLRQYQFVVEPQFAGNSPVFRQALQIGNLVDLFGNGVDLTLLQPDLIQVVPRLAEQLRENPELPQAFREEVLPDGSTQPIDAATDVRAGLRVADIKLTSEPGAHYFAEVVFYSMALSAWLRDERLDDRYYVVGAPAVVPGSYAESNVLVRLRDWNQAAYTPSPSELTRAFEEDVEVAPVEAFAPRIRQLVTQKLPTLLRTPWEEVQYHVDVRCRGCEFLGDPHIRDSNGLPTQHTLHCWAQAETSSHLSRVFGLSRGSASALRSNQIADVPSLATVAPPPGQQHIPAFQAHHGLRARRTVFPSRAQSLQQQIAALVPNSGGDALMPQWPSLHVYLFLDYDPATSLTITLGCRAFWREPLPYGSALQAQTLAWDRNNNLPQVYIIDRPTPADEQREFLRFLRHIRAIFASIDTRDSQDEQAGRRDNKTRRSTYQIYLWDEAQRRHLIRLVSRHLGAILADPALRQLAWLFPPPELLANPDTETRRTPYTLVYDVVRNTVALPAPHHYTLLEVARTFNALNVTPPSVHPLYRETLSNLAPPERIHEYWLRRANWQGNQALLIESTEKKLGALSIVVASLERRLGPLLSRLSAPQLPSVPNRPAGLAAQSYLWFEFARLNAALEGLETDRVRAMPTHEREARFRAALLTRRLRGAERLRAWAQLRATLPPTQQLASSILIYELSADSRELNVRPGDINYALAPAAEHGFLDRHPFTFLRNTPLRTWGNTVDEAGLTTVAILAIDRAAGIIALKADPRSQIRQLARHAPQIDLSRNVMLDPVHRDYLTQKIRLTLQAIGNPPCAVPAPRVAEALGLPPNFAAGNDPITPAAEVLWEAARLSATDSGRPVAAIRGRLAQHLEQRGALLMPDQWGALEHALGRLFTLIWGPPGTGKSHTLRAIIYGALLDAISREEPLRLLVTANTYTAVDNLLLKLQEDLRVLTRTLALERGDYRLVRVQSEKRPVEHNFIVDYPGIDNIELNRARPSPEARQLVQDLERPHGVLIIGAPAQQVHNLSVAGHGSPRPQSTMRAWFDLIVLDEASQMDVATSSLIFSKRAENGACVLAGDDLQLPPIHQAEAPEGLEDLVGSIYSYAQRHLGIDSCPLNVSFRSNATLIAFTREAGYDPALRAHSPELRLNIEPVPRQPPAGWPPGLPWEGDYELILDSTHPAICIVYDDRESAQSNAFEAGHVAALVTLLRTRLRRGLLNELNPFGQRIVDGREMAPPLYSAEEFWDHGVGVVVPHRAQMGLIVGRLQALFPNDPADRVRAAVDTVERFQGQERDVIVASFGLGDPDVIAAEEEFLYSLNRFNVMASRARAKLIVMLTQSVVEHLSDSTAVLNESLLLKRFAEQFCHPIPATIAVTGPWQLRWR